LRQDNVNNMKVLRYKPNKRAGLATGNLDDGMIEDQSGGYVSYYDYKWMSDYADRLVEHKDMVCLPADLQNLRNANAALAQENFELKQLLKKLN